MNNKSFAFLALTFFIACNSQFSTVFGQGTAFTYQGRLDSGGTPYNGSVELVFTLWDAATNGTQLAATSPASTIVNASNGLFLAAVDFGGAFPATNRWLEIDLRTVIGPFTTVWPRQPLTPVPYAMFAATASNLSGTVSAGQIMGGTIGNAVLPASPNFSGVVAASSFAGNGANVTNVNAATLNGLSATNFWKLGGNAISAGQIFGSTDNQPVEFWVNNARAFRLEPNSTAPNVIGGSIGNYVAPGVYGATIGGGGRAGYGYTNKITDGVGTIAGGNDNSVGAFAATIAGGGGNKIETNANAGAIGGGAENWIQGSLLSFGTAYSTIGGGGYNTINSNSEYATIPGGYENVAGGDYSFAAGQQAQALHQGAFTWADSQDTTFASTTTDEFNIRAQNGVRIQADKGIHLNGADRPILVRDWDVFAANAPSYKAGIGRWGLFMEPSTLTLGIPGDFVAGSPHFQIAKYSTNGTLTQLVQVDLSGNTIVKGTVTANGVLLTSDRNAKENFQPLNGREVLAKVAALPVTEWNYKSDDQTQKHIGPMAQDFQAAFQLTSDDKHISVVDEGGVALAAIQGLNQKLEAETKAKDAEIAALQQSVAGLKQQLQRLAEKK